jgi:predicted phosphodiesterase
MGELTRLAVFGGVYSNHRALAAALADIRGRGVDAIYCLGDLGAFGPSPDRVFPLLRDAGVYCVQGNYDHSIGNGLDDCQCGYTDPRDNHFARVSYEYTLEHTSDENRNWLRELPPMRRVKVGEIRLLMCHGSPRQTNEFLWESTCSDHFLNCLLDGHNADVVLATHTGIKWHRRLPGDRHFVNVGVLGRPENDGTRRVWYALIEIGTGFHLTFIPVDYDANGLADEMRGEGLPEQFVETILSGWWTTCLEVLPSKERRRGRY